MRMLWTVLFIAGATIVTYVIVIYPLLLGALARRAKPVQKGDRLESVSVIIAVHNGARFIRDKIESVLRLDYPRDLLEVIVVSDGSTDETDEIVREFAARGVRLMPVARGGKCAALNAAIPTARGEILLLTDVRQEIEPASLRKLVQCYADQSVGAVSGELIIRKGERQDEAETRLYWLYESWIRKQLGRLDSIFGATGPFYSIRRRLTVPIPPDILLDDVYLPMPAFLQGYRLIVEPEARAYDYPTTRDTEFGRKVRTLAGNYQILMAFPQLLGPGNRMWFHFMSYKVGRLVLPWALVAIGVASFFLPGYWATAAVALQALFYGLAAIDPLFGAGNPLKRVSSPVRTFVAMMIAAVLGLRVFFVPPRSLWKETKVTLQEP
jgi:biofilm PGA synthesis N-glycosyltransferase PgaC